ncbi:MAG TPA: hypothetical protein PK443_06650 [bacterium]|jgi:hypothetical protein|nr:hypothetical protein [bacterium]
MTKTVETKWKDRFFSPQEVAELESVFNERFLSNLNKDENISAEAYVSKGALYITFILCNDEQTYYYPFDMVIEEKESKGLTEEEAKLVLLDFAGSYFEEFFKSGRELYMPIDWKEYSLNGLKFYAKAQVLNKKLEKEADRILKEAGFDFDMDDDTNEEEK